MKADPQAQVALLELQAIDTDIDRTTHKQRTLPQTAAAAEMTARAADLADAAVRAQTRVQDLTRALRKAEDDVASVRARSDRDRTLLSSGQVTSGKQLSDLEHEVASLERRQADLEDAELEVMEAVEAAESEVTAIAAQRERVDADLALAIEARDDALDGLANERADLDQRRTVVVGELPGDLVALYVKLRHGGSTIAAGLFRFGRCEACQMELSTADLSAVRSAEPDEVLRCPECRAIIVRTEESGL